MAAKKSSSRELPRASVSASSPARQAPPLELQLCCGSRCQDFSRAQETSTLEPLCHLEERRGSQDISSDPKNESASKPGLWWRFHPLWTPVGRSVAVLLLWVLSGLLGFTYLAEKRLSWVDTVYLMCQIITTVGYGDLPPPKRNIGFLFYAFYVLSACMLVAQLVSTFATDLLTPPVTSGFLEKLGRGFASFVKAAAVWSFFVFSFGAFFVFYPGEEMSVSESLYMGVITLTTVGFGDYVPKTEPGKLFASLWMLLGTVAFTMMIGKFGIWSFFVFNKLSVETLDAQSLHRMLTASEFQDVKSARATLIGTLLNDFESDKYHEVSQAYAEKISRNDFLMFMILDMGLIDEEMIHTLSKHFDFLDVTGEGYIDKNDLAKAMRDEKLERQG